MENKDKYKKLVSFFRLQSATIYLFKPKKYYFIRLF